MPRHAPNVLGWENFTKQQKVSFFNKRHYDNNIEKEQLRWKKYKQENPEKVKANNDKNNLKNKLIRDAKRKPKEILPEGRKRCAKCKNVKLLEEFNKWSRAKDGYSFQCKNCRKEFRKNNAEKIKLRSKLSYELNKTERRRKSAEHYKKHPESRTNYRKNNRDKVNASKRTYSQRKSQDLNWRIVQRAQKRLHRVLKDSDITESRTIENFCGCDAPFYKDYLNSTMPEGYDWNDLLAGKLSIDHIICCSLADKNNMDELKLVFHYSNLTLIPANENSRKTDYLPDGAKTGKLLPEEKKARLTLYFECGQLKPEYKNWYINQKLLENPSYLIEQLARAKEEKQSNLADALTNEEIEDNNSCLF